MSTLFGAFRPQANIENPGVPLTDSSLLTYLGISPNGSPELSINAVLGVPSAYRALMLSATVPASLPFKAYKASDEDRTPMAPNTQAQRLMSSPHPDMTPFEFWQMIHFHRKAWGNAYCLKVGPLDRNANPMTVESLIPIEPRFVRVYRDAKTNTKLFVVNPYGEPDDFESAAILTEQQVLHFPGMGYDGVSGVSPIRLARESFDISISAQSFGAKFYKSGAMATGILQTEQRLTSVQADQLSKRWRERHTGLANAFETIVLDKGAKFSPLSINPVDAQFLQSRQFQVTEMCRWFGVPPFLMFETEHSTSWGTGLEQQALAWVKFDVVPELVSLEQRMSRLLTPSPAYAKHSIEGLLRGDAASRSAFYTSMWNIGVLSTNEIRAYEEMGPVPDGDVRYRALNMGELGQPSPAAPGMPAADPTNTNDLALEG